MCKDGSCQFLIAVPVKSFDSGDSNRDLHMLQATKGAQFPMVTVRTQMPESVITTGTIHADLEIGFAGQTAHYKQVPLQLEVTGSQVHLSGTVPTTVSDFKIDPPTLLTVPIKNDMPVRLDMKWAKQ